MGTKENQGLQIALIIFVMLTIVLSVTTFLFFKKYEETRQQIADHQKKQGEAETKKGEADTELGDIKQNMLGFGRTEVISVINTAFADDKKSLGALVGKKPDAPVVAPEGDAAATPADTGPKMSYRDMVKRLKTELDAKHQRMTKGADDLVAREKDNATNRVADKGKMDVFEQGQKTAETQREKDFKTFQDDRTKLTKLMTDQAGLVATKSKSLDESDTKRTNLEKELTGKLEKTTRERDALAEELRIRNRGNVEVADGQVTWVSARDRVVYINLGDADRLRPQVTFSVYSVDASKLEASQSKGKIEVTRVLGPHSAEARIVEDYRNDPILPRDHIYSPVWHPGRQIHFAFAGSFDLNGDGTSDLQTVRDLVSTNGGIIDAEVTEDGKRTGTMSVNTRYLVLGDPPTDVQGKRMLEAYTAIIGESQKLGVAQMNVQQFLDMMGYKADERTVQLGKGASPRDFTGAPKGGPIRKPATTTKDVFRDRRPPTPTTGKEEEAGAAKDK